MIELDQRESDGIIVTLEWDPAANELYVHVNDTKKGDEFTIARFPHEDAREAFLHPYAYGSVTA
jgi:carotenoid cleavage dioxygenase-like enzyme